MRLDRLFHLSRAGILAAALVPVVAACASAAGNPSLTPAASVAGIAASPAASSMAVTIGMGKAGSVGTVLTGDGGRTLYVFKKDSMDHSACSGGCATTWPPLTVGSPAAASAAAGIGGSLGTFMRADGALQVTYNGAPLYYYSGDAAAGDAHGQGIGRVWFAATSAGAQPAGSTSAGSTPASPAGGGYGY